MATRRLGLKLESVLPMSVEVSLAQYCEARGLGTVWVSELRGRDALVTMGVLGAATEQVRLASSVVPIFGRTAVATAMAAATVNEVAPGRVAVGIGTSSKLAVEQWHGQSFDAPLSTMRSYLQVMRQVLSGSQTDVHGSTVSSSGFRFDNPELLAAEIPLYVAALGPAMQTLAATVADGVLLNAVPLSQLPGVCSEIRRQADRAGRRGDDFLIAGDLRVGVVDDPQRAERILERQRKFLAYYGNVSVYNQAFARHGYRTEAEALKEAWRHGGAADAVKAVSDAMLGDIVVVGSAEVVADRVRACWAAGMDEVVLYPCWAHDEDPAAAVQRAVELVELVSSDLSCDTAGSGGAARQ